jgi:site-specific DNA recombinase
VAPKEAEESEMIKAAIYSRFSTDRQNESSIDDQLRVCGEWCAREGLQVAARFEDRAISGASTENRPGFKAMMRAALEREFDAIVSIDTSRLSRDIGDLAQAVKRLKFWGLRVVGVHDAFDTARDGHEVLIGVSGIVSEQYRSMVRSRTRAALMSRAKTQRAAGGVAYGYTPIARQDGSRWWAVVPAEAEIVREVYTRHAAGESGRMIANDLNQRGVPSAGSRWLKKARRCGGWATSSVRVIVRNRRYVGEVVWNVTENSKNPDTGKRIKTKRPKSEWVISSDESLRIVDDVLWARAQRQTRLGNDPRMKSGGRLKYLLSGLLRCHECGSHYVLASKDGYSCSSYHVGRTCQNRTYVRRDALQSKILGPIQDDLLAPDRVKRMAREMEADYLRRRQASETRAAEMPHELVDLDARIARLRDRLRQGDADMPADEIQAAIDRAEGKREELAAAQPAARASAKVLAMLPKAAELYRRQITQGLGGDQRATLKARVIVRELLSGGVTLVPGQDGSLWAEFALNPSALVRLGTVGAPDRS